MEEKDTVVFTDDNGNDIELDVIDYFDYNGNEYAILIDQTEACEHEHTDDGECDCSPSVYIFRIIVNEEEDTEEFVAPDEEDMDALIEIVNSKIDCECDCDDDCCCDENDCDCGCDCESECVETKDTEKCDCGCGCEGK